MKVSISVLTIIFSISVISYAGAVPAPGTQELFSKNEPFSKWEKLGVRKVNFRTDRDEILVTGQKGVFSALKLKVYQGGINIQKMVVHFRDGSKQNVALRQNIPAGGETRVIDLKGNRRIIQKVVFWYDTKNFAGRRATVQLWGKH